MRFELQLMLLIVLLGPCCQQSRKHIDSCFQKAQETLNKMAYNQEKVDVVISPISIHLASAKALFTNGVQVAAQNVSAKGNGAYTGEISADQLVDFGVVWTLTGHSERRALYGESNELVAQKTKYALEK